MVLDGKMYTVGGDDSTLLSSVECFDSLTGQWSAVAAMNTAREYVAVAALECPE